MIYIKDNEGKMVAVKRIAKKDAKKYTCEVLPKEGCVKGWRQGAENKRYWYISKEVFESQFLQFMDIE